MSEMLFAAGAIGAGLVFLVAGGELLVRGASALAALLRIGPLVIGLTVVAFGTSAPEVAVSVQAAYAGSGDLAIGNLVGSNIANVLLILGLAAVVAPITVSSKLVQFDVPLVIGASLLLLLFGLDGKIHVWEGGLFFVYYLAYITYLVLDATDHSGSEGFGLVMMGFVLPLTVVTLLVCTLRASHASATSSD